jgi:hypothetical protein
MTNEPFGRQPKPVIVTIMGEREDVQYWMCELTRLASFKGDNIELRHENIFTIYPRAVND